MRKVFLAAPSFGFGPISTSIAIARDLRRHFEIVFITSGEAGRYLEKSTDFTWIDADTRAKENFQKTLSYICKDDIIIVNTDVEYATFLIRRNFHVIVVDTLYWMWNAVPKEYAQYPFFISQVYYGRNIGHLTPKPKCRPLIDYDATYPDGLTDPRYALISFGGMDEPGECSHLLTISRDIVRKIDTCLPKTVDRIYVIGGLFFSEEREFSNRVTVLGSVDRNSYKALYRRCGLLFLSPGLTSLYEMLLDNRLFCLLPGLNVSQIYQIWDFSRICGYPYCIQWPDTRQLIGQFDNLPELQGLEILREYLLEDQVLARSNFRQIITRYCNAGNNDMEALQSVKETLFNCRDAIELILEMAERFAQ